MPVFQLTDQILFPPPELAEPDGLLAVGGDLSPERLICAYTHGIFPWYSKGDPILWWFTSPRLVLFPDELHTPKRLARTIRKKQFTVTFDTAFDQVISACSNSRTKNRDETWILPEMIEAYIQLHKLGFAHSVECWSGSTLAGGLYGIRLGKVFFGESMFTTITDGSKVAFVHLVQQAINLGIRLIDCQMTTDHLLRFGAKEIDGQLFQQLLKKNIHSPSPDGKWNL